MQLVKEFKGAEEILDIRRRYGYITSRTWYLLKIGESDETVILLE